MELNDAATAINLASVQMLPVADFLFIADLSDPVGTLKPVGDFIRCKKGYF
jgi:hypothetical protein